MKPGAGVRTRELAQIHIAKKQLGLDDETYREMLWTIARTRSSGDLDFTGRKRVLEHMKARGFKVQPPKRRDPDRPANMDHPDRGPSLRKIGALLADAERPWAYANGIAQKMFHVEKIGWLDVAQLGAIITALAIDQKRRRAGAKR